MVGPPGCVVVGPESRVNLRNNNLHIFWSNIVDLFAQQRGGIDTMGAHLNLPSAVAGNHLVRIDRVFQLRGIGCETEQSQRDRNNVSRSMGRQETADL
jgi:hypothetical protein